MLASLETDRAIRGNCQVFGILRATQVDFTSSDLVSDHDGKRQATKLAQGGGAITPLRKLHFARFDGLTDSEINKQRRRKRKIAQMKALS